MKKPFNKNLQQIVKDGLSTCEMHIKNHDWTDIEKQEFETFISSYNFDKNKNIPNKYIKVDYQPGPLTSLQFSYLQEDGFAPPLLLPHFTKELQSAMIEDINSYVDNMHSSGSTSHKGSMYINWFIPSINEMINQNRDYLLSLVKQISGIDSDDKLIMTAHLITAGLDAQSHYLKLEQNGYMLHDDISSVSMWTQECGVKQEDYIINLHIALTDVTKNHCPIGFVPKTHKENIYADAAYRESLVQELLTDLESDNALKALFISSQLSKSLDKTTTLENGETPDYALGMCASYKYIEQNNDPNLEGVFYENNAGSFITFYPTTLHGAFSLCDSDNSRISIILSFFHKQAAPSFLNEYHIFNDKYYAGSMLSYFTDRISKAKKCIFEVEKLKKSLSTHYNVTEEIMSRYFDKLQSYPDNQYLSYANALTSESLPIFISISELDSFLSGLATANQLNMLVPDDIRILSGEL
jgi:ectoine hydroxylase-related dioxygenase (phytanoyl-CoA dioxygenase family)